GRRNSRGRVTVAERSNSSAKPLTGLPAAVLGNDENVGVVLLQRGCDARQPGATALPNVPGEDPHPPHSPAIFPPTRRPLTSAPASGDMRRKNGTESREIAPTTASAKEKSAGPDTSRPCIANIRYSSDAPVPTPTLCDNCCAMLVSEVARLSMPGGTSA